MTNLNEYDFIAFYNIYLIKFGNLRTVVNDSVSDVQFFHIAHMELIANIRRPARSLGALLILTEFMDAAAKGIRGAKGVKRRYCCFVGFL